MMILGDYFTSIFILIFVFIVVIFGCLCKGRTKKANSDQETEVLAGKSYILI